MYTLIVKITNHKHLMSGTPLTIGYKTTPSTHTICHIKSFAISPLVLHNNYLTLIDEIREYISTNFTS